MPEYLESSLNHFPFRHFFFYVWYNWLNINCIFGWMDRMAWWASLLSTAGIRLNTAYLHTTRIEFIQCAGKSLFLAYSGRIMSFWLFFPPCLFGFVPTLRIFQPQTFICKLINDLHLTPQYEKMRAHCSSLQICLRFNSLSYKKSEKSSKPSRLLTAGVWSKLLLVLEGNGRVRVHTSTSIFLGIYFVQNIFGLCIKLTCLLLTIDSWLTSYITAISRLL